MASGIYFSGDLHIVDESNPHILLRAANVCSYTIEEDHVSGAPSGNKLVVRMNDQSEHTIGLDQRQKAMRGVTLLNDIINRAKLDLQGLDINGHPY